MSIARLQVKQILDGILLNKPFEYRDLKKKGNGYTVYITEIYEIGRDSNAFWKRWWREPSEGESNGCFECCKITDELKKIFDVKDLGGVAFSAGELFLSAKK